MFFKPQLQPQQEHTNAAQELNLLQQTKQLVLSDTSRQPLPTVSCRLWVGDETVHKLPAPSFDAFNTAV